MTAPQPGDVWALQGGSGSVRVAEFGTLLGYRPNGESTAAYAHMPVGAVLVLRNGKPVGGDQS